MKIVNSFYPHNNIHTYTHKGSLQLQKSHKDYCIADRKLSQLCLDVIVCRGSDISSDHLLTLAKLRFSPQ